MADGGNVRNEAGQEGVVGVAERTLVVEQEAAVDGALRMADNGVAARPAALELRIRLRKQGMNR